MIAGVTSLGPSHSTPANGFANVEAAMATVYLRLPTSVNVNVPSSALVADATFEPSGIEQVEVHAG